MLATTLLQLGSTLATATADTGVNSPNLFMPLDASVTGDDTDWTMWFINWITIFFGVAVIGAMVAFAIIFRHRPGRPEEGKGASHSTTLEITWTLIPTLIVLVMFTFGFRGYLSSQVPPADAIQINAMGRMWNWYFTYPDGQGGGSGTLYVPVNEPVVLTLSSEDVIHSLFIPAFRAKKDVVPGRYNKMWFLADKEGVYELFCTEYCGTSHSKMATKVHVVSREKYEAQMRIVANRFIGVNPDGTTYDKPVEQVGLEIWQELGCATCHSVDGSELQCPTWKGLYGAQRPLADGSSILADEAYLRESIKYPGVKLVQGYGNVMPSYAASLSEEEGRDEIGAVIAYIKTLSDNVKTNPLGDSFDEDNTSLGGPNVDDRSSVEDPAVGEDEDAEHE